MPAEDENDIDGHDHKEKTPFSETWKAMEELVDEGLTKNIGVRYALPALTRTAADSKVDVKQHGRKPASGPAALCSLRTPSAADRDAPISDPGCDGQAGEATWHSYHRVFFVRPTKLRRVGNRQGTQESDGAGLRGESSAGT